MSHSDGAVAGSLRFAVGERVRCRTGPMTWDAGTIAQLRYREEEWPAGRQVPYQIELDDGRLIFAPLDSDQLIRSDADFERLYEADREEDEPASEGIRQDLLSRYPRKHAALFEPTELPRFLDPALSQALYSESGEARARALESLGTVASRGLFSIRFFTDEFCAMLLEEVEHFEAWCDAEGLPVHRPNTMNNHGAILDDFGMKSMMRAVMLEVVQPLANLLGYKDVGGDTLDSHHAFVVAYALGKDLDLSFHVDSSDVTLNVCLGRSFEGGDLFFRGVRCRCHQQTGAPPHETTTFAHTPGVALLHRGHHRHGAHKITSGERINLILWCRSSELDRSSEGANRHPHTCQDWCWLHGAASA